MPGFKSTSAVTPRKVVMEIVTKRKRYPSNVRCKALAVVTRNRAKIWTQSRKSG